MSGYSLDAATASRFAEIALGHVTREYPHKIDHVMTSERDVYTPRSVHPVFFGSFDWHSCVHGYWLLARVLRSYPTVPEAGAIRALFASQFQAGKVQAECDYLAVPSSRNFEQPYGWAWLLMLAAELRHIEAEEGTSWSQALTPLRVSVVERLKAYLSRLTYPVRCGTHTNTAFALVLAAEYATIFADSAFQDLLRARTLQWFGHDRNAAAWEPSGEDFLSPTLLEAEAMHRLAPTPEFPRWFKEFLPALASGLPKTLFTPALVSDRENGKIGHLDGLNLSRAWCFRLLSRRLPLGSPEHAVVSAAADAHFDASSSTLTANYLSEHWLASFALLALTVPG